MWAYRERVFATYKQQLPPLVEPSAQHVVFVRNKRRFENLDELMVRTQSVLHAVHVPGAEEGRTPRHRRAPRRPRQGAGGTGASG